MAKAPEPCLNQFCHSPTACDCWGYCRERNFVNGVPSEKVQERWRQLARSRSNEVKALHGQVQS